MAEIQWNDNFNVGIAEIDEQHKTLIGIINKLIVTLEKGHYVDIVEEILNSLIDYSNIHFDTEEKWMQKYNYNEFEMHKIQHQYFKTKIFELTQRFESGEKYIKLEMLLYLKDWFIYHVCKVDKRIGEHINKFNR